MTPAYYGCSTGSACAGLLLPCRRGIRPFAPVRSPIRRDSAITVERATRFRITERFGDRWHGTRSRRAPRPRVDADSLDERRERRRRLRPWSEVRLRSPGGAWRAARGSIVGSCRADRLWRRFKPIRCAGWSRSARLGSRSPQPSATLRPRRISSWRRVAVGAVRRVGLRARRAAVGAVACGARPGRRGAALGAARATLLRGLPARLRRGGLGASLAAAVALGLLAVVSPVAASLIQDPSEIAVGNLDHGHRLPWIFGRAIGTPEAAGARARRRPGASSPSRRCSPSGAGSPATSTTSSGTGWPP